MSRSESVRGMALCVDSKCLPWCVAAEGGFGEGGREKVLRRDTKSGATSKLLHLAAGLSGVVANPCDVFVLQGSGRINETSYSAGSFFSIRGSFELDLHDDTFVVVFSDSVMSTEEFSGEATPVTVTNSFELPWLPSEGNGSASRNNFTKTLSRTDDRIVFLSAMLPGHINPHEEAHPISEETFRLSGSLSDGTSERSLPGTYAYRPPNAWHGPIVSLEGTVSLVKVSGPITTDYRIPTMGAQDLKQLTAAFESPAI